MRRRARTALSVRAKLRFRPTKRCFHRWDRKSIPSYLADSAALRGCSAVEAAPGAGLKAGIASRDSAKVSTFDQFCPWLSPIDFCQTNELSEPLEEVMENFAELMQRLLEIQSGGRQRSPELIAEDERLMDGL